MQRQPSEGRPDTTIEGPPPRGQYYDVGGRQLLLHRSGSGSPAVVFMPGGGAVGLDYLNVQERAAASRSSNATSARNGCGPVCKRRRTSTNSTTRSVRQARCPKCR
jgi:hypothetical protein